MKRFVCYIKSVIIYVESIMFIVYTHRINCNRCLHLFRQKMANHRPTIITKRIVLNSMHGTGKQIFGYEYLISSTPNQAQTKHIIMNDASFFVLVFLFFGFYQVLFQFRKGASSHCRSVSGGLFFLCIVIIHNVISFG